MEVRVENNTWSEPVLTGTFISIIIIQALLFLTLT